MFAEVIVPSVTVYLIGILCLLVLWQVYRMNVMAGRILAVDIFDGSAIRMYVYVTPEGEHLCGVCAKSHRRIFTPSQVAKKRFSPLGAACQSRHRCPGVLVGLYGAWPEAQRVVDRLRAVRRDAQQLSEEELHGLVGGQWHRSISADTDRMSVHMIQAMVQERTNPSAALVGYRYVIDQAKDIRHVPFLVPAYLRLVHLLHSSGQVKEALQRIQNFEARFVPTERAPYYPSDEQRDRLRSHKAGLCKVEGARKYREVAAQPSDSVIMNYWRNEPYSA